MRRAKGSGSIRRRGNSWQVRYLGPPDKEGKRSYVSETVHGLRKEADRLLREKTGQVETGNYVEKTIETVGNYLESWLDTYAAHNTSLRTQQGYRGNIGRYVVPLIGTIPLQALRAHHIQEMQTSLFNRGLSGTTILHVHRILKQALNHAVTWEKLSRNPAWAVKAPKIQKKEMKMWSLNTIGEFRRVSKQSSHHNFYEMALVTGMRRSEIAGLRWESVDLERGVLQVVSTIQRITGKGLVEGVPKTNKSRRSIELGLDAVSLLRRIRIAQSEQKLSVGSIWREYGYVFTNSDGGPVDPDEVTKDFGVIVKQHSLPHLTFHGLRHAHATLLLTSGIQPKVISERLGHSNISITMDTYSHVLPNLQKEAAAAIDEVLARATG
jgi:integrase